MDEGLAKVEATVASTLLETLDPLLRAHISTFIHLCLHLQQFQRHQPHQHLHQLGLWKQYR